MQANIPLLHREKSYWVVYDVFVYFLQIKISPHPTRVKKAEIMTGYH